MGKNKLRMEDSKRLELFEEVRAKYSRFLAGVLWKLTGNSERFSEAYQYALLRIWQNVEKLGGETAGAYIYRIALSANSLAWRHRVGRDVELEAEWAEGKKAKDDVSESEEFDLVRRYVGQLPDKQGRAIVMRYLEQLEYSDIAELLGCSEVSARSHVSKALSKLREKFNSDCGRGKVGNG